MLPSDARDAFDDFHSRSLARIPSTIERLIYIASTRDYNSGLYHHEGLASRFNPIAAARALEYAHLKAFQAVCLLSLRQLSDELERYMKDSRERPSAFLNAWQKLQPYRVAIPMCADPTVADVFISNVKVVLAILRHRYREVTENPSVALQRQSPAQQSLLQNRS